MFDKIVQLAITQNASDIHFASDLPVMLRINGSIVKITGAENPTEKQIKDWFNPFLSEYHKKTFEENKQVDFAAQSGDTNFRANMYKTSKGTSVALRKIDSKIRSFEDLGSPEILKNLCNLNDGIILVTGPTGSGKSTTLATMIDHINTNFAKHIITVEDPIEFIHESKRCLVTQREVGRDAIGFYEALRGALREDPDVILVGEMRDRETIRLALTAAETGHLVFGTLHTNSAAKTIDRIVDVFEAEEKDFIRTMLSGSLRGTIAQRLLKKKDGKGRVAAYEVLLMEDAVKNLIRQNKIAQVASMMQMGSQRGMITMKSSVDTLLKAGLISQETADATLNIVSYKGK